MLTTLVGLAVMLAPSQGSGDAVAVVNGEAISSSDYYHRVEHLNGMYAQYNGRLLEVPPGLVAFDRLITERLTIQLATLHGVAPKADAIDKAYADRLAGNPTMEKDAEAMGLSTADLKNGVAVDLARFNLITEGVFITDQEVLDEYKNNPERFKTPRLVDFRYIVVDNDTDKAAVDADLAAGKDFGEVAKARSIDISKTTGGLQKGLDIESLDATIRDALKAIKIGQSTDWIPVPNQHAGGTLVEKVLYLAASEQAVIPLDDSLRERIRRKLMLDRGTIKNNLTKEMNEMIRAAKIDIKDPTFAKAWDELRKKALDAAAKSGG